MAKGKASTSRPAGQKTLNSFFGGSDKPKSSKKSKTQTKRVEDDDEGVSTDEQTEPQSGGDDAVMTESDGDGDGGPPTRPTSAEPSDIEMDDAEEEETEAVETKKNVRASAPDASTLPPINRLPAIFDDLVANIPDIKGVAERVQGRKLRVATMCSGTESPLLALELMQKSIEEQHGIKLGIEHVFSCEIEPFKQAYIERNFQPPILFRDVCELGDDEAHTAYGALVPVPGDVDMLVAGTSCVDYSNLNNEKKGIEANGESGRTFRGMMSWVKNHRPPIVILENVCSAPWDSVKRYFESAGYSAAWSRVDTKNYYIPHTRTRVYLVAIDKKKSSIPEKWKDTVLNKLKRPASSTLDAFLLPSDDPRIHVAREKLVRESYGGLEKRTGRTDWTRCESRHQRARLEEELGSKRPLTSWDDGGFCKLPDFAWNDWGVGQVERVWDLMDISLLRAATKGVDPSYKTVVWNLSQNVDRTIGSNKVGICPCLTPSMIPYITNRGGPMVGLEALSMQGLPVDKLLLTRESEDQLADLAGNAMSSTVVGACILAALVCAKNMLKEGNDQETYESKGKIEGADGATERMEVDEGRDASIGRQAEILGEDKLTKKPLDLLPTGELTLSDLLSHASRSARLCVCEGRAGMTNRDLFRCQDCASTFCKKCGGRPEHNVEPCTDIRTHPNDFSRVIKSALPMSISLEGISESLLDALKENGEVGIKPAVWTKWRSAVLAVKDHEIRFVELKRQELWSAIFQSPTATLELILHPQRPEWRLFAVPDAGEAASAQIRQILIHPVARLVCKDGLLSGDWEFALPAPVTFRITIEGSGELVPSWEARLGLVGEAFKDKKVYSKIQVSVPEEHIPLLDRDITGEYVLLDKCGTANGALHKKVPRADEHSLPSLFLLFDPHRTNDNEDCFVFSTSIRRLEYMETRPMVCKLDPSWRQSDVQGTQKVVAHLPWKWVKTSDVAMKASEVRDASYGIPMGQMELEMTPDACRSAYALLSCSLPLGSQAGSEWPRGQWGEVDKVNEKSVFKSLAWLLEPIRHVGDNFRDWQALGLPADFDCKCESCAPSPPAIRWVKGKTGVVPLEDPVQAGEYERRLKRRPSPFVTQLKLDKDGVATARIGINIPSLVHRALASLPPKVNAPSPTLSWRLDTNYSPSAAIMPAQFKLLSNKDDIEHSQPPHFKMDLRPEQLRSLTWMIAQESDEAPDFIEEEIAEAILDPMGWRAEGKAERPIRVLGGVLADQVGYGKTAITLGLIDCTQATVKKSFVKAKREKGRIGTPATLIVVPGHLPKQWESETKKFLKSGKLKVIVLKTVADLNKITIEDIQEADIVIASSTLQRSNAYQQNLSQFAGVSDFPSSAGRHFRTHLQITMEALKIQVDRLQDEDSEAVLNEIKAAEQRIKEEAEAAAANVVSKRLKGKAYQEAAEQAERAKKESDDEEEEAEVKSAKAATRQSKSAGSKPKSTHVSPSPEPGSSQGKASKTSSGLVPEVVITRRSPYDGSSPSSPPAESEEEQQQRPRRGATGRRPIVVESDDDEEEPPKPSAKKAKGKGAKGSKGKGKKKSKGSEESDFQASSDEDSEEAESLDEFEASDDSAPKPKAKRPPTKKATKATGKAKTKAASTPTSESEADMDVDEPTNKKKTAQTKAGKKRKAEDDGGQPAKKKKRLLTDPWKLGSRAVKNDFTQMKCPPLEMFRFARIVVDEYTYLDGIVYAMVSNLCGDRQWVLSGTPPIHDFAAVKTIAAFLKIHLGVDDISEGQAQDVKKRQKDLTSVEKFHSFREVHSPEWHAHRVTVGQRFLDQFVRQNVAEIDEIHWEIQRLVVNLPAAERAIYLELEHHLRALDMTIKRGRKNESDREKRLNKSLGDSSSAEEALLKRCSHFDLDTNNDNENAVKACDVIVKERETQLEECKSSLLKAIKAAVTREKALVNNVSQESMFNEYIRVCRVEGLDDADATAAIIEILDEASAGQGKQPKAKKEDSLTESMKAKVWEHREKTHEIRRITKELTGRIRSLRYFTVVRDIQKHKANRPPVNCPSCGKDIPLSDVAVLSSCGHEGCLSCVRECADKEECVYAASGKCKSAARVINIVKAETLGEDDVQRDAKGKHFGRKLERVVELIKSQIPKEDRVLIFVQFTDLIKKLTAALDHKNIEYIEIKGSSQQMSEALDKFQNQGTGRVLILNVTEEKAAGANLTCANHAIFLSPLLTDSNEKYKANETQAIGRLVRFGQQKPVTIWRMVAADTIDEEIYEQRKAALATVPE